MNLNEDSVRFMQTFERFRGERAANGSEWLKTAFFNAFSPVLAGLIRSNQQVTLLNVHGN